VLRWVHPEKARYYQADLVEDLLGDWSLITVWGGLDSHQGQVRRAWVASYEAGVKRLQEIGRRRRQDGYQPIPEIGGECLAALKEAG
jgi:hypothetical protein